MSKPATTEPKSALSQIATAMAYARAAKLTPARREEIARKASAASKKIRARRKRDLAQGKQVE